VGGKRQKAVGKIEGDFLVEMNKRLTRRLKML
jgi:hypothetical protein